MWDKQRRTPFDPFSYPEIVDRFLELTLSSDTAKKLRRVNTLYADLVDPILMKNLDVTPFYKEGVPALKLSAEGPLRTSFTSPDSVSTRLTKLLSLVRVLDVSKPKRDRYRRSNDSKIVPIEKYGELVTQLAPYLTNLDTVRQHANLGPNCAPPFTATTLVTEAVLEVRHEPYGSLVSILNSASFTTLHLEWIDINWEQSTVHPALANRAVANAHYPSNVNTVEVRLGHYDARTYCAQEHLKEPIINSLLDIKALIERDDLKLVILSHDEKNCQNSLSPTILSLLASNGAKEAQVADAMTRITFESLRYNRRGQPSGSMYYSSWLLPSSYDLEYTIDTLHTVFLERLEKSFISQTDAFTASGNVILEGSLSNIGMYLKDSSNTARWIDLPLDAASADTVYNAGQPSPFGRRAELVFDESYRSARQIMPPNFSLAADVLTHGAVLQRIQLSLETSPLYATLSKLNVYAEGGMFKAHRDTPRGSNHLGTITMCLPSPFSGGELVVRHNGGVQVFDWGSVAGSGQEVIQWAFLFSDSEHEVLPVKSGKRVTIAYDVFTIPKPELQTIIGVAPHQELICEFQQALDNPQFLPDGGVLAFGLLHEYATAPSEDADFAYMLKGIDRTWKQALVDVGLEHEFVAVYQNYKSRTQTRKKLSYKQRVYAVSRDFFEYEGKYDGHSEDVKIEEIPVKNIHWVTKPDAWGIENSYIAYGNEPEATSTYVAVAIYAYVGRPGERTSGTAE